MDAHEAEMRDVLLQLALTGWGRTASYNTAGGDSDGLPPIEEKVPAYEWFKVWNRATDDAARARAVEGARKELHAIRHSSAPPRLVPETKVELEQRIVEQGKGFPASEVAISLRCAQRTVERARLDAGREPKHGRAVEKPTTPAQRLALVSRLAAEGATAMQIAAVTGVPYNTVRRDLGRM